MSATMIQRKGQKLGQFFQSEEEFIDLMTKRILDEQMYNDDEEDLDIDDKSQARYGYGAAGMDARVKRRNPNT